MSFFSADHDVRSVYIHWPFCPYKCHFCPFVALASHDQFMERYHRALVSEIEHITKAVGKRHAVDTIFFGGGTPSTYPDELLLDMFATLRKNFIFDDQSEITLEVNPGTVRPSQLLLWKSIGINRLSIGVQSIKDGVLKELNRHQRATDVIALLQEAQNHFSALSVDLILGLPGVSAQEWRELIHTVVQWPINHVSVYFLTVHEETPLYFKVARKKVTLPCDDETIALYYWTCDFLRDHGLEQYELSNFARPRYESRHNRVYWQRKSYYGFGLGACAFNGTHRIQNEKNLMSYMKQCEDGLSVVTFSEELTADQERLESLMLGLRQRDGLSYASMMYGLSPEQTFLLTSSIKQLCDDGFIEDKKGTLRLTPKGLVVENEIVTRLSV